MLLSAYKILSLNCFDYFHRYRFEAMLVDGRSQSQAVVLALAKHPAVGTFPCTE
jgi:hypothetical protein